MEPYTLENQEASIVFVGSFNPAIFHPEWLLRHDLIPEDDKKAANVEIVHRDISKFNLEWFSVEIVSNRFVIRTNDPAKYMPLKDLMVSIFKILNHTPITQLGMNLSLTYKIDTEENWHKIGDTLAPKPIWENSLPKRVGMVSLKVQSPRTDSLNGYINVVVNSVRSDFYGVNLTINNHVELTSGLKNETGGNDAPTILADNWEPALVLARKIGETTLAKVIGA